MCVGPATRRAGVTHTFPFLCSAACCAAMLLSCFSLWLVVNFACLRPGVRASRRVPRSCQSRLLSPPRLLSIAETVVASSSAYRLKQVGKRALLLTRQGEVFRCAVRETAKVCMSPHLWNAAAGGAGARHGGWRGSGGRGAKTSER